MPGVRLQDQIRRYLGLSDPSSRSEDDDLFFHVGQVDRTQICMGQNVRMTISADDSVRIVTAVLRDGDRVLLCHRSAGRRWYPDVWDLPGGHVEEGEDPKESLVRELREELGITASEPSSPPMHEIRTATFDMQIWLIDRWTGTPVNAAPDEHDAVAWFETSDLDSLRLAHESYLSMLTAVLVT
ncbi:NUDIX domain-containing protein [Microtetraspora malaysiensis]|uniref:NUDIX domain-containing protein n=1 Tax=Microtetraspora malaysiensis TaxID=161358 RepID=UPI001FE1466B|nr:NUDIX hydrolase [Microtetraspora malaysiensis]